MRYGFATLAMIEGGEPPLEFEVCNKQEARDVLIDLYEMEKRGRERAELEARQLKFWPE